MADKINNNPWLGLSSYKYEDASRFYGRDKELQDLANIIRQNSFTTIYGVSGAGKTSIINAGLFPVLDKENYLPIYIRLNHGEGRLGYDDQIVNAVEDALSKNDAESELMVEASIDSKLDKLWLYFHSHRFWTADNHKLIPILFIDQFEEIFTKNEDVNDVWSFFNVIDSLQYNMPTERILAKIQEADQCVTFGEEMNFRVVFSMREDFLPRLEDYCFDIPAMRRNRVGLKPLNGLQALEVITKPRPDIVSRDVALHIISKIVGKQVKDNQRRLEATSVDTSILSLFCTELYNYGKIDENGGCITISLVDLYGGNILEWFYDRNMQALPKKTYVYLENQLLTHSGFRNSAALEDLLENGVTQEQLDSLEENRIIRIEDVNHNLRVEFTHDVLCKIAKKRKDERESVERAKGEASARKVFTFESSLFLSIIFFFFLTLYYVGFDDGAFFYLLALPFVFLFFMLFAHRHVADKNFSTMFWTILGAIGFIAGFTYFSVELCDKIDSIQIKGTMYLGYIFILPLLFILSPLIVNIHKAISLDKKGMKLCILFYAIIFIVVCAESLAFGYCIVEAKHVDINITYWTKLLIYESPLCLILLSPAMILYNNRKNPTAWNIASAIYCYYEVIVIILLVIGANKGWYSNCSSKEEIYGIPLLLISGCIVVLYAFYGIQYMRLPKEQTFMTYCENVLTFQSFKKYKSFGTRLKTIAIILFVVYVWMTATSYIDYVPFISLPLSCILVLYAASKEIDMTTKKQVFSRKVLIPLVILSELIVALQYTDGYIKQGMLYLSMMIIAVGTFMFFAHKEVLKGNKILIAKLVGLSFFVSFLLPSMCVGYSMCNPSLTNISRVWGGRISSNLYGVNFLTVENDKGEMGVMDYSEIIIEPQSKSIHKECYISYHMHQKIHPIENLFIPNSRRYSIDTEQHAHYLRFVGENKDGKSVDYEDNAFLKTRNKYGRYITEEWLNDCSISIDENDYAMVDTVVVDSVVVEEYSDTVAEFPELIEVKPNKQNNEEITILYRDDFDYTTAQTMLDFGNLNINDTERQNAIVQLFIKRLFDNRKNQDTEKERETFTLLKDCSTSLSLAPLLSYKGSKISSSKFINAAMKIAPLLCYDKSGQMKELIFGQLWDKYAKDCPRTFKPLCLLLANEKAKALSLISTQKQILHESISDISILCVIHLCSNETGAAYKLIENYIESKKNKEGDAEELFHRIVEMCKFIKNVGGGIINDNTIENIAKMLHVSNSTITVDCDEFNLSYHCDKFFVHVSCSSEWYVEECTGEWVEWTKYNDCIELEVYDNYDDYPRKGCIVLSSGLNSVRIHIKQDCWTY